MDTKKRFPHPQAQRKKHEGLDWGALREGYKQRRIAEGATEEELASELIDAHEVVLSDTQRAAKSNAKVTLPQTGAEQQQKPRAKRSGPHTGGRQKSPKLMDDIKVANERGLTRTEIAELCGVSMTTVKNYLSDLGLTPNRDKPGPQKTTTPEAVAKKKAEWHKNNRRKSPVKCPKCGREDIRCHKTHGGFYCKEQGFFRGDDGSGSNNG